MKFFKYPLAIVAYALIFIFGIAMAWHYLGHESPAAYWYFFPEVAGIYLLVCFILSRIPMTWELEVVFQVAFVLAPILYYVNLREPYKRPVYVFITEPEAEGTLEIHFNYEKDAPTNARSHADTIYFKFDNEGRMLINEDVDYVKKMMKKNLFIFFPDHTRKHVPLVDKNAVPVGKREVVAIEDSMQVDKGKLKAIYYHLVKPKD